MLQKINNPTIFIVFWRKQKIVIKIIIKLTTEAIKATLTGNKESKQTKPTN